MGADSPVSVIIPTHARPDYLRTSLESALAQTLAPHEIIVVSDVDDQDAELLCAQLTGAVPVRYVRNRGVGGASASRNVGAAESSGTHLAFLDDDDFWAPKYLEHAAAASSAALEPDAVVCWLMMFRDADRTPGLKIGPGFEARDVVAENPGVTGSNIVVAKRAFDLIDGFDENLPVKNDGDFFYRFLSAGLSYAVSPEFDVLQRKHSSGQLTGRTEFRAAGLEKYLKKHSGVMTRADRRHMLLSINRIRYHAARTKGRKITYLIKGAWYSSPRSIVRSARGSKSRSYWITSGFADS